MDNYFLKQARDELAGTLRISGEIVFQDLCLRYQESHRAYHTLSQIEHCLREFSDVRVLSENADYIKLALWFHDAIYDPKENDNEVKSAQLARNLLHPLGIPQAALDRVVELVMATTHSVQPADADARLLVDVNLSILGAKGELFNA